MIKDNPKYVRFVESWISKDSFREKIVQQAIYIILNSIYDSSFLNSSHDFYLYKNTYKILKEIKYKFQDVK